MLAHRQKRRALYTLPLRRSALGETPISGKPQNIPVDLLKLETHQSLDELFGELIPFELTAQKMREERTCRFVMSFTFMTAGCTQSGWSANGINRSKVGTGCRSRSSGKMSGPLQMKEIRAPMTKLQLVAEFVEYVEAYSFCRLGG